MRVDFRLKNEATPVLQRDENPVSTTEAPATSSPADKHLRRALWILLGYGLAKVNLRRWTGVFFQQAAAADHKGLFVSVVTLLVTLYVLCILAPMNAVAEWDVRWRGGGSGRRGEGITTSSSRVR